MIDPATTPQLADAVAAVPWFAATAIVARSAWRAGRALFPGDGVGESVAHAVTLGWACVLASAFLTSLTVGLRAAALIPAAVVLAWTTGVVARRFGERLAVRAGVGGGMPVAPGWPSVFGCAWGWVATTYALHVAINGLWTFPADWDSLAYHIPVIDQWLQAGSLGATECGDWYVPGNNEVLGLWAVAPFTGDFFIALTNAPSVALLAASGLGVAARLGLPVSLRHPVALLLVGNGVVLRQLAGAENDVAVAALLTASLLYHLRYLASGRRADLALWAVALGLLAGVKYYALGYAAVSALAQLASSWVRGGVRALPRVAAAATLGALAFGGFWYARNAFAGGSPLFPLVLAPGGAAGDLGSVYPRVWDSTLLHQLEAGVLVRFVGKVFEISGLGHAAALALSPVTVLWLAATGVARARRSGRAGDGAPRVVTAFVTGASLLVLLATPFLVEDVPGTRNQLASGYTPFRYGLAAISIALVGLAVVLNDLAPGACRGVARPVAVAAFAVWLHQVVGSLRYGCESWPAVALTSFNLCLLAAALRALSRAPSWRRAAVVRLAIFAAAVLAAWAAGTASARWGSGFAGFYDAHFRTDCFSALPAGVPSRIAALVPRPYPFYGPRRECRVSRPYRVPSRPWMSSYLAGRGTGLVAVANPGTVRYPKEAADWLDGLGDAYTPVAKTGSVSIYRARGTARVAGAAPADRPEVQQEARTDADRRS